MTYYKRKPNPQKILEREIHNKRMDFLERLSFAAIIGFSGYALTAIPRIIKDFPNIIIKDFVPNIISAFASIVFFVIAVYVISRRK